MLCGIRVIFFGISLNGGKTWYKGKTFYFKMLYILFVCLFLWGKNMSLDRILGLLVLNYHMSMSK